MYTGSYTTPHSHNVGGLKFQSESVGTASSRVSPFFGLLWFCTAISSWKAQPSSMGPIVKKEIYTTAQPDGTLLTTTTTIRRGDEVVDYDLDWASLNSVYCCSGYGILRILEIVVGFIIVGLCVAPPMGFGPFGGVLGGHTFAIIQACICVIITFVLLVLFLFGLYLVFDEVNWRYVDIVYGIVALILHLIAGCFEAYFAGKLLGHDCRSFLQGSYTSCSEFILLAVASAFCFLNVILYGIGVVLAANSRFYL